MKNTLSFAAILFFVLFSALASYSQTPDEMRLERGKTIERTLKKDGKDLYLVDLKKGELLYVSVEQKNIDIAAAIAGETDRKTLKAVDAEKTSTGTENLYFVAESDGTYILGIFASGTADAGSYVLKTDPPISASSEKEWLANSLFNDGAKLDGENRQETALLYYLNAAKIYAEFPAGEKISNDYANVLASVGVDYYSLKDYETAGKYFKQSADVYLSVKNVDSGSFQLRNAAFSQYALNKKREAIKFYEAALDFKTLDAQFKAETLNSLGFANYDVGNYEEAIKNHETALEINKTLKNAEIGYNAFRGISSANTSLGRYELALKNLDDAQIAIKDAKNDLLDSDILSAIASVYLETGEYDKSLDYFQQSQKIAEKIGQKTILANLLINIGTVYFRIAEYQKANENFVKSLAAGRELNDETVIAISLSDLGNTATRLKNYDAAIRFFDEAIPKLRALELFDGVAISNYYYGIILRERGDIANAVVRHKESVELTSKYKVKKYEARSLYELGVDYVALGKFVEATDNFNRAFSAADEIRALDNRARALEGLMDVWHRRKNNALAVFYGKQAVNTYQELRANTKKLDKNARKTFLESFEYVYRNLSGILIAEGRLPEAQAVLDLLKEEEFSGLVKRSGNSEENVPYSKAETSSLNAVGNLATLGREKSELAEKLEKGSLTDAEKTRYKQIAKEIETAENAFNQSLLDMSSEKNTAQNFNTVVNDAQAFMSDLKNLGKGTVALYTVIVKGEKKADETQEIKTGWVILVTPEFRKQYQIDVDDLEKTVFTFRAALKDDTYDPTEIAQTLYAKLFRQKGKDGKTLENDLDEYFKDKPEKTLMWSLDGVLRYVPMAALHDGKNYLVEKYRNTIFNTASKGRLSDETKKNWTVLGLGVSEAREESGKPFPKIEGTKRELDSIISENDKDAGILPGTVKMDAQFTAENMEDALLFDKNPVVHIASHFSFDAGDMDSSFLLLGKGKLSVKEMTAKSTLFANVDLLALSACDTAMGSGNGKEVEGFAYVAQSLGAKAVLASLWQVDDSGTDALMVGFYTKRKENAQMPKGEAFRQAQLAMLGGTDQMTNADTKDNRSGVYSPDGQKKTELPKYKKDNKKPFAHPHYWAAFVLIGNWR